MEIRQLKYFLAIFDEKHVGRAAQKCFVTQPALTQQIHKLEDELKTSLLMPNGRGIAITDAGKKFIPHARAIIESVDKALQAFSPEASIERGEVVLGVSSRVNTLLLNILPSLRSLKITLKIMQHEQMMHELTSGKISLGIMHSTQEQDCFERRAVLCEKMYFVVSNTYLAIQDDRCINIKDVLKTPIILLSDKVLSRDIFRNYIGKVRPNMNLVSELDSIDELTEVLKYSSIGTILPSSQLPKNMQGLRKMEILNQPIHYELSLLWNKKFSGQDRINSFVSALSEIIYTDQPSYFYMPSYLLSHS